MAEIGLIWADDADLSALYEYVENQRPLIAQFPLLEAQIISFEAWYQGLTWWDVHVMINNTIAEAVRRRDLINQMTGDLADPTIVPADRLSPDHIAPGTTLLPGAKPPLIPTEYKLAATITAAAIAALVVLKKLYII